MVNIPTRIMQPLTQQSIMDPGLMRIAGSLNSSNVLSVNNGYYSSTGLPLGSAATAGLGGVAAGMMIGSAMQNGGLNSGNFFDSSPQNGYNQPGYNAPQNGYGSQPGYNTPQGAQQGYNTSQGAYGAQQGYNTSQGAYGAQQGYNTSQGAYGAQQGYNTSQGAYGAQQGYNTSQGAYGAQQGYNTSQGAYGAQQGYNTPQGAYGAPGQPGAAAPNTAMPAYGNQQPAYGNQPPAYGNQQPAYGNQQPAYGNQQPAYGNQQPAYGNQQAGANNRPSGPQAPAQPGFGSRPSGPSPVQPAFSAGSSTSGSANTQPAFGAGAQPDPLPFKPVPNLQYRILKGQKNSIETHGKLSKLKVSLGWNVNNAACDVDVSAFLLNSSGKVPGDTWFVFYGQDTSPDGSTVFQVDNGSDRENILIDLTKLDPSVQKIVFVVTINEALEKHLNFSMLKDCYIRLIDPTNNKELVSFMIEEYYPNITSMMIGEIYLHNGAWKFNAIGNGVARDLAGLCELYGVQVV